MVSPSGECPAIALTGGGAYNAAIMPSEIEIRAGTEQDLAQLNAYLPRGAAAIHAERLARQQRGEAVYLIAWQGDRPVGHAFLKWDGSADAAVADRLDGPCPDVEDLFVA